MSFLSTYVNDRIRLGGSLVADARTSVPTVRGDYCMRYILFACSLGARPAQGAATTTDVDLVRTLERASLLVECDLIALGIHPHTNEPPNRMRSLTHVCKHNILSIDCSSLCERTTKRPYGLLG